MSKTQRVRELFVAFVVTFSLSYQTAIAHEDTTGDHTPDLETDCSYCENTRPVEIPVHAYTQREWGRVNSEEIHGRIGRQISVNHPGISSLPSSHLFWILRHDLPETSPQFEDYKTERALLQVFNIQVWSNAEIEHAWDRVAEDTGVEVLDSRFDLPKYPVETELSIKLSLGEKSSILKVSMSLSPNENGDAIYILTYPDIALEKLAVNLAEFKELGHPNLNFVGMSGFIETTVQDAMWDALYYVVKLGDVPIEYGQQRRFGSLKDPMLGTRITLRSVNSLTEVQLQRSDTSDLLQPGFFK